MYDKILSHPVEEGSDECRLTKHHETVARRGRTFAEDQRATAPGGTDVSTLVSIAASVHDLGKAHPDFQAYLRGKRKAGLNHAPLGAVAAFHAARQRGLAPIDATIPLVAVARHHQRLPHAETPYEYIDDRYLGSYLAKDHANYLGNHLDAIEDVRQCIEGVRESYSKAVDRQAEWEGFTTALRNGELSESIKDAIWRRTVIDPAVKSGDYYAALLQTWSTLVLADKSDAADLNPQQVRSPPNPPERTTLERRVTQLGGDSTGREAALDNLRDKAFAEVNGKPLDENEGRVHEFLARDERIATLALPTGLGKTYTGLDAALTVRDAVDESSTVVYCLPYTSIIDQTAADIQNVFGCSPTGEQFTVDHYLEDTVTTVGRDEEDAEAERYTRDERFLGESWQANLVVTTFVQLFESLLGPSNSASTKLPNLTNAVVVLDEPQALPLDDWDRIRDAVDLLTRAYGARVILMTATQPRIFTPDDRFKPFSLIADSSRYFQSDTERVSYTFDPSTATNESPVTYELAATEILDTPGATATLAICNTIPSARRLAAAVVTRAEQAGYDHFDLNVVYDDLLSSDEDDIANAVFETTVERAIDRENPLITLHLTTRHRPIDRERLLTVADRLTERDVPFAFVATQLVEAGVDVSFQRVYRDFAPLDSIVQAAGRCNRNFERDRGHVTVWQLAPPDGDKLPSKAVYASEGNNLLAATRDAIRATAPFPADAVSGTTVADDAVERYYELVRERMTVSASEVQDCATKALNEYTLIDDRCLRSVDVVVCRTREDVQLAEATKMAFADGDFGTAFDRLDRLRNRTISVPIYSPEETPVERHAQLDPTGNVGTLWLESKKSLFDPRDGLTNEESVEDFIL